MTSLLSRRQILSRSAVGLGAALSAAAGAAGSEAAARKTEPFGYCLNMGTLLGHKLSVVEQVSVAAQAGWRAVELWMRDLRRYVEGGGSLRDLKAEIAERGLEVASAIGFPRWAVDDDAERAKGLEQLRRDMELVAAIGGRRIAAPPAGIHRTSGVDLRRVAERYRTVLELGRQLGVVPQLEIWGAALTLGTAAEAAFVALAADDPDACLLLDVFHLYKGNSGFAGLKLLNGAAMHVFHINDYPPDPPRQEANDSHRIFPGDGIAPLGEILKTLHDTGFRGMLSLELFNRQYWKEDPLTVARTGLEKTRAAVRRALA